MAVQRKSIVRPGRDHPVPEGTRVGNMFFSSNVTGLNIPGEDRRPNDADEEADWMFRNMKALMESAGGSLENIGLVNLYVSDQAGDKKDAIMESVNKAWLAAFPDANSRPARGLFERAQRINYACQIVAVLD
ncbi:MAG TPA: RidA family protein [Chloroflexota bacterium]